MTAVYPRWAYERTADDRLILNHYRQPIVSAEYFMEPHVATVPAAATPPWCSCGWTRHRMSDGTWIELADHLADMREAADNPQPDLPCPECRAPAGTQCAPWCVVAPAQPAG